MSYDGRVSQCLMDVTCFPCFQIGGIALVVVGGIALKKIGDVKHVFDDGDHPGFFPAAIIALGALVFVIAFFGCCGAIRESRKLTNRNFVRTTSIALFPRMPSESLLALPPDRRRSASPSRHLRVHLQPRHPGGRIQRMGPSVGRSSGLSVEPRSNQSNSTNHRVLRQQHIPRLWHRHSAVVLSTGRLGLQSAVLI